MKLRVVINDSLLVNQHFKRTGYELEATRRVVDIDFTDEQIGKLALKRLGLNDAAAPLHETIESTCIVEQKTLLRQ